MGSKVFHTWPWLRSKWFLMIAIPCIVLLILVLWVFVPLPDVSVLKSHYPLMQTNDAETSTVEFVADKPLTWIELDAIHPHVRCAVVVSEDWAFWDHKGFDFVQIRRSLEKNIEQGGYARGASTITQQVVKNLFLHKRKSLVRKLREWILAWRIEQVLSKEQILETYFNIVEWGEQIIGIAEASDLYFHRSPRTLGAKEGAFLAMLLPSPKRYAVSFDSGLLTPFAEKTVRSILEKMVTARCLTSEELSEEADRPLSFERGSDIKAENGWRTLAAGHGSV